MSQQKAQTTTIVRDGNTIIIAHPPVKKQTNYWELFTALFKSDSTAVTQTPKQEVPVVAVVEAVPVQIIQVSSQSIAKQPPFQCKQCNNSYSSQEWKQWAKYFSRQNINSYRTTLNAKIQSLHDIDTTLSSDITKFKEQNLLTLGDIRVRSILMAFSSAVLYRLISCNTTGLLRKTRNLGVSFVFMGYWFVPELFNPFLRRPALARNIV